MKYSIRKALWAFPIIFAFILFDPIRADPDSLPAHSDSSGKPSQAYQASVAKGAQALRRGQSDAALASFMDAYRLGMSKDSLLYFLAATALSHSALDTAMAFNLAIATPRQGPFRDSVLDQRYRLYARAGLDRDASAVADSMARDQAATTGRYPELNIRFSSGYFREGGYPASDYPFGTDLGDIRTEGAQYRHRAQLVWPLFRTGSVPWSGGIEYDLLKSYFKDSVDYRAGVLLKAGNLWHEGLSASLSAEIGNVSGTGLVSSYQFESSFLSFSERGITMFQGGLESEWNSEWENRISGFWVSYYRDRSVRTGSGVNYSLTVSGIRFDPIREASTQAVMYVDDVTKAEPIHYRDEAFQDVLPGNGNSAFGQYTSNTGFHQSLSVSPQSFLSVLPALGYGFPLPLSLSGEIGCHYAVTVFPDAYEWTEASLPEGFTEASGDFTGMALNQADGKKYAAVLIRENVGVQEHYGPSPISAEETLRIDQQAGAELSLRRDLGDWGTLSLDGMANRNWSTLAGAAPIWIPKWDMGAALKWSKAWKWR